MMVDKQAEIGMHKRILVAIANYPDERGLNNGKSEAKFEHVRNKYYSDHGQNVTVLNFASNKSYSYNGIKVISLHDFEKESDKYDILVSHAANIRNHYRFLKKYESRFPQLVFIYHGHEVLMTSKVYSKPYDFVRQSYIKTKLRDIYDAYKLYLWRSYLPRINYKTHYFFVSNWMKDEFLKWTRIPYNMIEDRCEILYNSVGETFEKGIFQTGKKEYDFITIRADLDNSKYAIDVVTRLAKNTPNMKFLLIGKGSFFEYNSKPDNIEWINTTLTHDKIVKMLDRARFALMPTRTDAQGLMMCEMAAYGMPVITSDIPVCHEVFDGFENAFFIDNDREEDLRRFKDVESKCIKDERYGGVLRTEGTGNHHKIRVLVIAETYPLPDGRVRTSNYFHERNKYYRSSGIEVDVLNFSIAKSYVLDDIKVFSAVEWKKKNASSRYDLLISHAPNLKHHLSFLKKYGGQFQHIILFFHGQEVLKISKVYPKPYSFQRQNSLRRIARDVYDDFKFRVWRSYLPKLAYKTDFIFVSAALRDQFFEGIKIKRAILNGKCHIVSNGIGREFEGVEFDFKQKKEFDFITVRSNMDSSTYCIDILCKLAEKNKDLRFLLIGEGEYFKHYAKPDNIILINTTLSHNELIDYLQKSRIALMLTRNDTQGVMSCEISSTGMPLITSDIKVCREVFACFQNVVLVQNDADIIDLKQMMKALEKNLPYEIARDYFAENTAGKEIDIIRSVMSQ